MLLAIEVGEAGTVHAQPASLRVPEEAPASPSGLGVERALPPPLGPSLSGAELEQATRALASTLRCPVCQGLSVEASPSESARAMRTQIEQLLAEGYTPDQIVAYFERSYGEFVRLVPKPRGFNLVVFALPAAGLLFGALLVVRTLRRRAAERAAPEAAAGTADPLAEYRERVRREVSG
jgi:cytochrome c-type biogenesis protein CcmH